MSLTFDLWEHWMLQCHILYTSTDMTSLFPTGQRSHFTHRESEWMHELTLNIRFYTSLQSVFIPSFVLCALKIAWHLMNHEGLYCIRAQRLTSPRGTGRFHDNLKTTGWHLFTRRTSAVGSDSFGMGKKVNYCKPSENRNSCFPE